LVFDVRRLFADRDLGDARQVDERQVHDVAREDFEVDRLGRDAFVCAGEPVRLCLDLPAHFVEVRERLSGEVREFGPVIAGRRRATPKWVVFANVAEIKQARVVQNTNPKGYEG
jgi:hypothetical protein